jgi:hypothetical protein
VWHFALSGLLSDLKDVAVAPNLQAYICGIHTHEGVFCLQPSGNFVWAVDNGVSGKFEPNYIEMDFGPGANGSTQIYFQDGDLTRSFAIHEDPPAVFTLPKVSGQPPVVSDFDGTWHRGGEAYDSNGDPMWTLAATTPLTTPAIAAGDGTHYTVNQSFRILALTPSGQQDWSRELDEGVRGPAVDPSGAQLLMPIDTIAGNLLLSEGALTEQSLSADVVAAQGLSQTRGLRVAHAPPGSAAARAGLRRGDVIVGYRGKAVESHGGLRRLAAEDDSGAEEQFTVVRQGELQLVSATGKLPAAIRASSAGNGADLWRVELAAPADGSVADVEETGIAFSPSGDMAYVLAYGSAPGLPSTVHLYALATDPSIPNASTQLRSSEVSVRGRKKGRKVSVSGTVTDDRRREQGGRRGCRGPRRVVDPERHRDADRDHREQRRGIVQRQQWDRVLRALGRRRCGWRRCCGRRFQGRVYLRSVAQRSEERSAPRVLTSSLHPETPSLAFPDTLRGRRGFPRSVCCCRWVARSASAPRLREQARWTLQARFVRSRARCIVPVGVPC